MGTLPPAASQTVDVVLQATVEGKITNRAIVTAVAARWRYGGRAVPVLVTLLLFAFAVAVTAFMCFLHERLDAHPISNPQSLSLVGWTLFLAVGSVLLLTNGLRRPGPEARGDPPSRSG